MTCEQETRPTLHEPHSERRTLAQLGDPREQNVNELTLTITEKSDLQPEARFT